MSSSRPATVRFYFDADLLGLGKLLCGLRGDMTYPGDPGAVIHKRRRPACPVTRPRTPDTEWIPVVAQQGWLIVTRDNAIIDNRAEINAVRDSGAKMVALSATDASSKWGQLELFMTQWRRIEALVNEAGPFIHRISRTVITPIPLD